jgi:D-alanyl-D-alanine carboxypeptidase (penicillin-binding protein 5/6)
MRKLLLFILLFTFILHPVAVTADGGAYMPAVIEADESEETSFQDDIFDPDMWVETMASSADIPLNVKSAVLMEKETGQILYTFNEHERLAPASITKIMTMLLVAEAIDFGKLNLDDIVTVSTHASQMGGSQIYLKENEQMTVRDMLKSVAVASANDACVALAEHTAGSEAAFVKKMNARAAELGMTDTSFKNSNGLPEQGHLTSAYDIALMSRELISHQWVRKFTTIWTDSVRNGTFDLANTNKLIRFYPGATGLKTGYTDDALYCLSATAERDGAEYIAVVMGAPTSAQRFDAAKTLLNYVFATYTLADVCADAPIAPIPVLLGERKYVQPIVGGAEKIVIEKTEADNLNKSVLLPDSVSAPLTKGQEIGRLVIKDSAGKVITDVALVADSDIDKLTWFQIFVKYLQLLFAGSD